MSFDIKFMKEAIKEAKKAKAKGECPIGAVIVKDGKVISRGHNLRETKHSPTAHAEIIAIEKACKKLSSWRLTDCDLYVTLEPCCMCSGAIIQSRIRNIYYGAHDKKAGAAGSVCNLYEPGMFNHDVAVTSTIMQKECSDLLKNFFREIRKKQKEAKNKKESDCNS